MKHQPVTVWLVGLLALTWGACAADTWKPHDMTRPRPPVRDPGPPSATEFAPPPADAIVLFGGADLAQWERKPKAKDKDQTPEPKWKIEKGYFEIVPYSGDLVTKEKFGDCQIHIEWAFMRPRNQAEKTEQTLLALALALLGIAQTMWFVDAPRALSTGFYVAMGWLAVVPSWKLAGSLSHPAIALLVLGGLLYTLGGVIYALYTSSGYPLAGTGNELTAIASVGLGGTLLTGGVGLVAGTLFGGMILASFIGIFAIPPLYVFFQAIRERLRPAARPQQRPPTSMEPLPAGSPGKAAE